MYRRQTLQEWQGVFWMTAGVYLFTWLAFVIFGSTEIQSWNYGPEGEGRVEKELKDEEEGKLLQVNGEQKPQMIASGEQTTQLANGEQRIQQTSHV